MEIRYPTRSKFFEPIDEVIRRVSDDLVRAVRIDLIPGGYRREAHIFISDSDTNTFESDWESAHPDRFSARLRAAASVLRRRGFRGRFKAHHENGVLTLQRA